MLLDRHICDIIRQQRVKALLLWALDLSVQIQNYNPNNQSIFSKDTEQNTIFSIKQVQFNDTH